MADNKQVDQRVHATSTAPRQTWNEEQLRIQDAQHAQERAATAAVNAANRAASHASAQQLMSNTLDAGDFGIPFTVTPAAATPKGRSTRKGK